MNFCKITPKAENNYEPENFELISVTDMDPVDPGLKVVGFKYLG